MNCFNEKLYIILDANRIYFSRINMMKNYFILLSFIAQTLSLPVLADITISETADTVVITSDTLGFGGNPSVRVHDDFDDTSVKPGDLLNGWSLYGSGPSTHHPRYSNDFAVTGMFSGVSSFMNKNYNSSAEFKNLGGLRTVYLSYYVKIDHLSGEPSRNIKIARLSGGHKNNTYNQAIGITFFHNYNNGAISQASKDHAKSKVPATWIPSYVDGKWHRVEHYIELSTPGQSNGSSTTSIDGNVLADIRNVENDETGMTYEWLSLPYYVAQDTNSDYKIYYDNVVASKSQARVELCEVEIYNKCKQPIIGKIKNWNNSKIEFFRNNLTGKKPYIFIFNENNELVNKNSIAVTYVNNNNFTRHRTVHPKNGVYFCPSCPSAPVPES